jgi:hypothetical protein
MAEDYKCQKCGMVWNVQQSAGTPMHCDQPMVHQPRKS